MKVEYHVIRDVDLGDRQYDSDEEIAADKALAEQVHRDRFSITSVCDGRNGKVYCGCTNRAGDVLYEFDVSSGTMRGLGFDKLAEPNDMKIHKGLWLDEGRNSLFFALATLSPIGRVVVGPGARVMRYDIGSETFEEIARPAPGSYIQATSYDAARQLVYSFTLPGLGFAVTEVAGGRTRWNIPTESIVHISSIDPAGGVWGTHSIGRHAFFRYDPDADTFDFNAGCLHSSNEAANVMYNGAGPVDCMVTGPDGMLYVATALAEIYRVDPESKEVTYLARPLPHRRLPAILFGPDGRLYGVGGDNWHVTLFAMDVTTGAVEIFGEVHADDGRTCFRPHDMVCVDDVFYVGETDNQRQSGVLWACTL